MVAVELAPCHIGAEYQVGVEHRARPELVRTIPLEEAAAGETDHGRHRTAACLDCDPLDLRDDLERRGEARAEGPEREEAVGEVRHDDLGHGVIGAREDRVDEQAPVDATGHRGTP